MRSVGEEKCKKFELSNNVPSTDAIANPFEGEKYQFMFCNL